jgi:uncharacterized membrane protein YeaQ/YmgE (transglycosylase-associated protein family)
MPNSLGEWIALIIVGAIIGALGKFVAPGDRDNIPIWAVLLCGIGGVIIGAIIYHAFGGNGSSGIDWTRWIVAILTAAVLTMIASALLGRRSTTVARR